MLREDKGREGDGECSHPPGLLYTPVALGTLASRRNTARHHALVCPTHSQSPTTPVRGSTLVYQAGGSEDPGRTKKRIFRARSVVVSMADHVHA